MEYVLVVFAVGSMMLNFILLRKLMKVLRVECVPLEFDMQVEEMKDSDEVKVISVVEPRTDSVTEREQPNFQAWTNKKNIPWSEFDRPRQQPVRSQRSGPLERPPGFV